MPNNYTNWRYDHGMESRPVYKKRFALWRKVCADGSVVWLKPYYKKYLIWSTSTGAASYDKDYYHKEFIEDVSEAEYIVRKLAENL